MIYFKLYYRFDDEVDRSSDNGRDTEVWTTSEEAASMSRNDGKEKVCC